MLVPVFKWLLGCFATIVVSILLMLIIGEALMRAGLLLPVIKYDKSDPMVPYAAPNQKATMYVAHHTYRCPPLTIDSEGMRGPETDWSKKVILLLGSSQVLGTGVADDEVCSRVLDRQLQVAAPNTFTVVNGALAGFGPYHQAEILDRIVAEHPLHAVMVRVSIWDLNLRPKKTKERGPVVNWFRENTMFFSTLARKAASQSKLIRAVRLHFSVHKPPHPNEIDSQELGRYRFHEHKEYWQRIITACSSRGIPLIFIVMNPNGTDAQAVLQKGLNLLAADQRGVVVVEAGPRSFGLDTIPIEDRPKEYRKRWTLRCDPHCNAVQHEMLGSQMMQLLVALRLVGDTSKP